MTWTDLERSTQANIGLGSALAFVAGATNAGGFLAVGTYTSHMTGVVSSVADYLVLGQWSVVLIGVCSLGAFLAGAMTTAWMVNWSLQRKLRSAFGRPLLLEAILLLCFGVFGSAAEAKFWFFEPLTIVLLCYLMGLQNAVVTKISKAEIRTTHLTGLVTDLGIELGKLVYINGHTDTPVRANRERLRLQLRMVACFFGGALVGAMGFKWVGYSTTVPLALILMALVWRPLWADYQAWRARQGQAI